MSLPLHSTIDENNRIVLTGLVSSDSGGWGLYQITKKCRYKVVLPSEERETPIACPNAQAVSSVLQEYGRNFTTQDVYNYFSARRCIANKSSARLNGATIIKM